MYLQAIFISAVCFSPPISTDFMKNKIQHTDPDSAWDQAVLGRVAAALSRAPWCTAAKLFHCIINTDNLGTTMLWCFLWKLYKIIQLRVPWQNSRVG